MMAIDREAQGNYDLRYVNPNSRYGLFHDLMNAITIMNRSDYCMYIVRVSDGKVVASTAKETPNCTVKKEDWR